ncbi:hypothetical protein FVE85_2373 [Porphyridium purpureum]|uniref:Uncharacterized protein n=1 Tax=Porphyridium purpureum TaxID=35688 RepID=A0A5J4YYM0_PORPP|nr:hypothetical protein FVE85_2373 [Porphyridium purpureum]|eukprot:POR8997..scf209_3
MGSKKAGGAGKATEEVLIMRMVAASELVDHKPWVYEEKEKDGTMQAMRFIAAQQFLLSWQTGKVPVGWSRPRRIEDFQDMYGEEVVKKAQARVANHKKELAEKEQIRLTKFLNAVAGGQELAPESEASALESKASVQLSKMVGEGLVDTQMAMPLGRGSTTVDRSKVLQFQKDMEKDLEVYELRRSARTDVYQDRPILAVHDEDDAGQNAGAATIAATATATSSSLNREASSSSSSAPQAASETPAPAAAGGDPYAGKSKAYIMAMEKKAQKDKELKEKLDKERAEQEAWEQHKTLEREKSKRMDEMAKGQKSRNKLVDSSDDDSSSSGESDESDESADKDAAAASSERPAVEDEKEADLVAPPEPPSLVAPAHASETPERSDTVKKDAAEEAIPPVNMWRSVLKSNKTLPDTPCEPSAPAPAPAPTPAPARPEESKKEEEAPTNMYKSMLKSHKKLPDTDDAAPASASPAPAPSNEAPANPWGSVLRSTKTLPDTEKAPVDAKETERETPTPAESASANPWGSVLRSTKKLPDTEEAPGDAKETERATPTPAESASANPWGSVLRSNKKVPDAEQASGDAKMTDLEPATPAESGSSKPWASALHPGSGKPPVQEKEKEEKVPVVAESPSYDVARSRWGTTQKSNDSSAKQIPDASPVNDGGSSSSKSNPWGGVLKKSPSSVEEPKPGSDEPQPVSEEVSTPSWFKDMDRKGSADHVAPAAAVESRDARPLAGAVAQVEADEQPSRPTSKLSASLTPEGQAELEALHAEREELRKDLEASLSMIGKLQARFQTVEKRLDNLFHPSSHK